MDAVVSPMVHHDPLSTRVGNTLYGLVGSQLTAKFRKQAEEETMPGDTVLVDGLNELPSNAVIFLNLIPWDEDPDGTSIQVKEWSVSFSCLYVRTLSGAVSQFSSSYYSILWF